jgi:hypothetical protein
VRTILAMLLLAMPCEPANRHCTSPEDAGCHEHLGVEIHSWEEKP